MLRNRLDAENNPALWELESFIHYKNIHEAPFGQALVCLEEIQSSNKLTVCGGNEIPDMLGKYQLSDYSLPREFKAGHQLHAGGKTR